MVPSPRPALESMFNLTFSVVGAVNQIIQLIYGFLCESRHIAVEQPACKQVGSDFRVPISEDASISAREASPVTC